MSPQRKTKTSGPGIYVHDPEKERRQPVEDSLGNVTPANSGRTYVTGFQRVRVELEGGVVLEMEISHNSDGLVIRNLGTMTPFSLCVLPHSSNVLVIRPAG